MSVEGGEKGWARRREVDGCRRPTHVKTRRRTERTNAPNDEAAVPEVKGKCGDEDNGEGRGAEATFCSGGMRGGGAHGSHCSRRHRKSCLHSRRQPRISDHRIIAEKRIKGGDDIGGECSSALSSLVAVPPTTGKQIPFPRLQ